MSHNVYCFLCGVVLHNNRHLGPLTTHGRKWVEEVRAIVVQDILHDVPYLTGVGVLSFRNILYAPLKGAVYYRDDVEPLENIVLSQPGEPRWGYGCHDSCWQLLCVRLSLANIDAGSHAVFSIARLLRATPCVDFSRFDFGHDYGGVTALHRAFESPPPIDSSLFFYADPARIQSCRALEQIGTGTPFFVESTWDDVSPRLPGVQGSYRCLLGLPTEIIHEILSYLPFPDVARARLVCRHLASLTQWHSLPPSFWKSRFMLGQDLDFLFPEFDEAHDWRRLCVGTILTLKANNLALVNRKRIRNLLEDIACHIQSDMVAPGDISGFPVSVVHSETKDRIFEVESDLEDQPETLTVNRLLSCRLHPLTRIQQAISNFRHVEQYRAAVFRGHNSENATQISVSTVSLRGRQLISGMKYHVFHHNREVSHAAGYYTSCQESSIELPPGAGIEAIEVAFCVDGLVGIRVHFTNGAFSEWIGQNDGEGIARGVLDLPEVPGESYVVAGLDSLKIVAIGFARANELEKVGGSHDELNCRVGSPIGRLWIPDVPDRESFVSSIVPREAPHAFAVINIDFGGPGGELLASLNRIVLHMTSDECAIIGMEFFYAHQSLKFGKDGGVGLSFTIDGPGGELILDVDVLTDYIEGALKGIKVLTNHGRSMYFCCLPRSACASTRLRLGIPEGHVITGFAAAQPEHQTHFSALGVQSQETKRKCDPTDSTDNQVERQDVLGGQLECDNELEYCISTLGLGVYGTVAQLLGVRRIQASVGYPSSSRPTSAISGLKLEYHDRRPPSILGQWMNEHDGLELGPEEKVQCVTIWLKENRKSCLRGTLSHGQIVSMRFHTTDNRSKTFLAGVSSARRGCTLQQHQSGASEELIGISWNLSSSFDSVRGVMFANDKYKDRRTLTLMPTLPPMFSRFKTLLFERPRDGDTPDLVTKIEAYCEHGSITGLAFAYQSNAVEAIGDVSTGTCLSVAVSDGSRIRGFLVGSLDDAIVEIEFQFEEDVMIPTQHLKTLKLSAPNEDQADKQQSSRTQRESWRISGHASDLAHSTQAPFVHELPHDAKLVGLYSSCMDFSRVGAVFHTPEE